MNRKPTSRKSGSNSNTISKLLIALAVILLIAGIVLLLIEPIKRHNRKKISSDALDIVASKIESSDPDRGEITYLVPATGNEVPGEEQELAADVEQEYEAGDMVELGAAGIISIEKMGIRYSVWEGVTEVSLRYGPCHYEGSVMPGEAGNATILGHNYKDGSMFHKLGNLSKGDEVVFTGTDGVKRTFIVQESKIVSADDLMKYAAGNITSDRQLTLVTCTYEYGNKGWRRVVICKMA